MKLHETKLTIHNITQLHKDLFWEIESRQSTELDLEKIKEIDFAVIQLFIAAKLHAKSQNKSFKLSSLQAQPLEVISLLGVDKLLEVPHG